MGYTEVKLLHNCYNCILKACCLKQRNIISQRLSHRCNIFVNYIYQTHSFPVSATLTCRQSRNTLTDNPDTHCRGFCLYSYD